jgi:hypothetical protein
VVDGWLLVRVHEEALEASVQDEKQKGSNEEDHGTTSAGMQVRMRNL